MDHLKVCQARALSAETENSTRETSSSTTVVADHDEAVNYAADTESVGFDAQVSGEEDGYFEEFDDERTSLGEDRDDDGTKWDGDSSYPESNYEELVDDEAAKADNETFNEKVVEDFIKGTQRRILSKVQAFYNSARPLNTDQNIGPAVHQVPIGAGRIITAHALLGDHESKRNEVRAAEKRWASKTKSFNKIISQIIKAGPVGPARGESRIVYRPFAGLLETWLNDISFWRIGYLASKPMPRPPNLVSASYPQSNNFHDTYATVLNKKGNNSFLLIPLNLWSDSAQMMSSRTGNGTGHMILLSILTASSIQNGIIGSGTRLLGFTSFKESMSHSNSTTNANLRQIIAAKSFEAILKEILTIQANHGVEMVVFGRKVCVIPYLPFFSGDLVESRKLSPTTSCPYCGRSNDNTRLLPLGTRFSPQIRQAVYLKEFAGGPDVVMPNHYKPILSFRERLNLDREENIYGMAPPTPDVLHCLLLNIGKATIRTVFAAVDPKLRRTFEKRLKTIPGFPKVFCNMQKAPTTVGADYATACMLLPVTLNATTQFVPDKNEYARLLELLDCLAILFKYGARDNISEENYSEIEDAVYVLPGLITTDTDILHTVVHHLFDRFSISEYGSPKVYFCARYESTIKLFKRGIGRASNRRTTWREDILLRAGKGDLLNRCLDFEPFYSPTLFPHFEKIVFLYGGKKIDIGFCDMSRGGTYSYSRFVRIHTDTIAKPNSRFSVVAFKLDDTLCIGFVKVVCASFKNKVLDTNCRFLISEESFQCELLVKRLPVGELCFEN
jgi:hypothetical protein